ncbi:MAG TPA: TonB-dependent receptor [Sphingopyxis sp.]|uniref:TonB-dependent receptor plug domain-containing protein n=1 Tax=Sphingopyxis sp. TaxID=1908224 RepID=UPI002B59195A|nr:TonB-dependent receptor [Sphingopyxis sp.]HWW56443.1 TonB-dependent receptor [Sphingopyxis sp.]
MTNTYLAAASLLAIALAAAPVQAQEAADADVASSDGDEIIVTGTRAAGRSRLDSPAPVDVLGGETLRRQGSTELGQALATVAPSIDFKRSSAVDGTDAIRPATLRGLSPDQTLVLINGVRGHTSALLNVNGSVGRGAASVDLNTIPTVALDRIEVLRDGAAAQYGSDAIAGVINLRLREAREGGGVSATYGFYATDIDTARGSRSKTGEPVLTVSGWQGIGFGNDGFLTISGEYVDRKPTNRGDFDPRVTPNRVTSRFGDPEVEQATVFANAGVNVTEALQLYGWVGYQDRDSKSAAFPRIPSVVGAAYTVGGIWPDGFLPLINTKSRNLTSAVGLRGDVGEWNVDLNLSYGRNRIAFRTLDTANYSLGNNSPTEFYDGAVTYDQWIGGLDVSRKFDVFQSLNLAFGAEWRREGYKIAPGEAESYQNGGAQGFPGFSPLNTVDAHRRNLSAYIDVEAELTSRFLVAVAGRVEDYSDFGSTANGKVSARFDATDWLALRGTASTGFRAPSLQQQYYTSITSVVDSGNVLLTGHYPSIDPVAVALGGLPLEPEKSTNFSLGGVIHSGAFSLTVDAYQIKIRNQIALSENIRGTGVPGDPINAILDPREVQAARFFINGVRSKTQGIDIVAAYKARTANLGTFDFTVAANFNDVDVTRVPTSTATLNPAPTLLGRARILTLEEGTPREKVSGAVDWAGDALGATLRATYYGSVNQPGSAANGSADILTGKHVITDLELRYAPAKGAQVALGASNLFDVYPDATPAGLNSTGVIGFPYYSPFGFNGRYLYARIGLTW